MKRFLGLFMLRAEAMVLLPIRVILLSKNIVLHYFSLSYNM